MANEILYGQSIDMDDLQILNFVAHSSPSAPTNADTLGGMLWWKSDSYDLRVYNDNDSAWNSLVQGPSNSTDLNIPTWNGTGGNKLNDGLSLVTTLGDPGSDTTIVSEAGIRTAINSLTIAALGDIGDVTITDIANNEMLVWEDDHWENQTRAENNLATFDGNSVVSRVPYWSNAQGLLNDGYLVTSDLNVDNSSDYLVRADAIPNGFPTNFVIFEGSQSPSEAEGTVWWNSNEHTLNIATGLGPVIQVGQEFLFLVYNDTGSTLEDGKVGYAPGPSTGGIPHAEYAKADSHSTIFGALGIFTQDILPGQVGLATTQGKVRGVDNNSLSLGYVYVSATTAGDLTNVKPQFPNYAIEMGGATKIGTTDGEFTVLQSTRVPDTILNFWNGVFRESFAFTVTSNGTVITGSLAPTNGNVNMTMMFSDGFSILATDPSADIVLTAGTDGVPQMNYIYVLQSTKVLTVSTSSFPTDVEHIKVAAVFVQTAATVQTDKALKNHNWNDHIQATIDNMGHMSHMGQKLRKFEAQWDTGSELTTVLRTVPSPDELYVTVTGGIVYQLHRQVVNAFDTEASDHIHVWNHFTTPYVYIQNLASQTEDALGNTLANKHFSIVIWGVVNSAGEPAQLFMNLPNDSYNSAADALADPDNHAIYTIPKDFSGAGYLIARLVLTFSGGTSTLTVVANEELLGKVPNTSAGGGSIGGAGATTYLALTDTDPTFVAHGGKVVQVNGAENALEFTNSITVDSIAEWTTDAGVSILNSDLKMSATEKLYLDGGTDTYITEASENKFHTVVGDNTLLRITDKSVAFGQQTDEDDPAGRFTLNYGNYYFRTMINPPAPTAALIETSGLLSDGVYRYTVIYVTDEGDSGTHSFYSNQVTVDSTHQQINLTDIPIAPDEYNVTARKIYRTTGGGNIYILYRVTTINDNTTTSFVDNVADGSLDTADGFYRKRNDAETSFFKDNGNKAYLRFFYTDTYSTIMGASAARFLTTGNSLVAFGSSAAYNTTTGGSFVAIGYSAMIANRTGSNNVAIGYGALYYNQTGHNNIAIGTYASSIIGYTAVSGVTAVGTNAGGVGNNASFVGYRAGRYRIGIGNAGFGYESMEGNSTYTLNTGTYNVGVGFRTGKALENGSYNIFLGGSTGATMVSGSRNILIGGTINASTTSVDDEFRLGYGTTFILEGSMAGTPWVGTSQIFKADTIDEFNADAGVTIESIELKDGGITLATGATVNEIETTLTNDASHIPTSSAVFTAIGSGMVYPGAGIALSTGSAWGTSIVNNSGDWNTAFGWGDHSGLYANLSHTHGNITNAGAIGSVANLPIITTTSGVLIVSSFGTGASTFCEGNDSRLSDSRTPTSHASSHLSTGGDTISLFNTASAVSGLVVGSSGAGATSFLNATGAWSVPAGSTTFISLTDSPADWTGGVGGFMVMVNGTPDALEFIDPSAYPINNFSATLTGSLDILGSVSNGISIKNAHGTIGSTELQMYDGQTTYLTAYTGTNWSGNWSIVLVGQQEAYMAVEYSPNVKRFHITAASMLITDTEDSIGLQYLADYSTAGASLGDRWIPDKGYVDSVAGVTPADNILDWNGTAYAPYAAQTTGAFDSGVVNPISAVNRLNFDGEFYAYNLYAGNATDHITITSGGQILIYTGGANQMIFQPYISDGAGAYAYSFDTENTLVTEGSKVVTFKSNGTERFVVFGQGELMISERSTTGLPTPAVTQGLIYMDSADDKLYFKNNSTTYDLTQLGGSGTVTSVVAGNGMNFTTITGSGSVIMGTPSTLTAETLNAVTATSHTHAVTGIPGYGSDNQIPYTNAAGLGYDYSSNFTFSNSLLYIGTPTSHAGNVYPSTTSSRTLGTSSLYWTATFTDQVTLATGIVLAYSGGNEMTFVDGVTSSKTLAQLAADTSPGGSPTHVQFNNSGVFGGSSKFVFDGNNVTIAQTVAGTTNILSITHSDNTVGGSNCILTLNVSGGATTNIYAYSDYVGGTLGGVDKNGASFIYAGSDSTSLTLVTAANVPIHFSPNNTLAASIVGIYSRFYAGHTATGNAWVDYPTALPQRALLIQRTAGQYILNDYNSIQMTASGGNGKNAYVTLAVQALSATDHRTRFNITLRGSASTAYETVFSVDYNSIYYWKVDSASADITHHLRQSGVTQAVFGWDETTGFQIHTGTGFQSTTITADFVISTSGYVYLGNIRNASNTNYLRYSSSTGEVTWLSSSDIRVKKNITEWEVDSLGFLMKQRLIRFDRRDGSSKNELGWDATQMEKLMPEMTWRDEKGYLNFKDAHFPLHFHRAIVQLGEKVAALETLEQRVTRLEIENVELRRQLLNLKN